jgi:hypothetical protein
MILKIRIISDEVETFFMNIEIDESDTFLSLHNMIQKECNFKNEQISSFFISNDDWEKGHEITLLDMGDENPSTSIMSDTSLQEHITSLNDKLIYVFDQFNDRGLFITVIDICNEQADIDYVCSHKTGNPPELTEEDIISLLKDSEDLFDDISGDSSETDYLNSDTEDFY